MRVPNATEPGTKCEHGIFKNQMRFKKGGNRATSDRLYAHNNILKGKFHIWPQNNYKTGEKPEGQTDPISRMYKVPLEVPLGWAATPPQPSPS